MLFANREEAGQLLARELEDLAGQPDVAVLAVPRGGVITGAVIARHLRVPIDVYITRKLGAPGNPELAIGAVAEDGTLVLDLESIQLLGVPESYIDDECERQRSEIQRRAARYRGGRAPIGLEGKRVVLVDDGVATGRTLEAAIQALRKHPIQALILAVPVGPPTTIEHLEPMVDRLVILAQPELFWAVGAFYQDFHQVSDEEVERVLREVNEVVAQADEVSADNASG